MAVYHINTEMAGSPQAMAATYKTVITLTAATATLTSATLFDIEFSAEGTPADNVMEWDVSRQTAAGTITAATPTANHPTRRACGTVGGVNATAEGTITAGSSVFYVSSNQRASYRFVAAPGAELIIPNVNLAGFAIRARSSAYTGTIAVGAYFSE